MPEKKTVDSYLTQHENWKDALQLSRALLLQEAFEETIKWGFPVYTIKGKNVVGLRIKAYGYFVFQGALLKDPTAARECSGRKNTSYATVALSVIEEIEQNAELIVAYLKEAAANQEAGKEIKPARSGKRPLTIPPELQQALDQNASLKDSFEALNLTKKRDFAEYIETAKREATKQSRLEKIIPMISDGLGLNDKYK